MSSLTSTFFRHKALVATLALSAAVCVTTLSVRSRAGRAPAETHSAQRAQVETEIITLRPTGFEPAEISRPGGRFLLAVNDRSGLGEVSYRLEREDGQMLREVRKRADRQDWREPVLLHHGTYRLSVVGHPEWVCTIHTGD
jgi:hypothetical protein